MRSIEETIRTDIDTAVAILRRGGSRAQFGQDEILAMAQLVGAERRWREERKIIEGWENDEGGGE